jgi:hypothetical protein
MLIKYSMSRLMIQLTMRLKMRLKMNDAFRRVVARRFVLLIMVLPILTLPILVLPILGIALLSPASLFGQPAPTQTEPAALEFSVVMRQNVVAGKTPVGTKVQAKVAVATLVRGVVVPQDAILSGAVTESTAKSGTEPSRLAVHMESAQWKGKSLPINVYLTAWYYPLATARDRDNQQSDGTHGSVQWGEPGPSRPMSRPSSPAPFPGSPNDGDNNTVSTPESTISNHRVPMKDVESLRSKTDGGVTLTSKRSNIKLDKTTTYVFASADLAGNSS